MKKAVLILIILVFSFLYYMGFLTKQETLPLSKDFFSIENPSATERGWELNKISPVSKEKLDSLYQVKLDKGIRNLPILSYFLVREAGKAIENGNPDRAAELAAYAIKFSPDLPQPYFQLAQVRWRQDYFQFFEALSLLFKGQMARLRHYPSSITFFYNTFYILWNAILLAFMVFGIVVMIKHLPLYFYDVRKSFTKEISMLFLTSLKVLFLLIPFFLRLDVLWAILFWSILLWGYATKSEKRFILLFLIVLVYAPLFLRASSSALDSSSSDVILRMYQANYEEWDKAGVEKIQGWSSNHPEDPEVLFTLGLIEKRQGHYPQAEEFYKKAIQRDPKFSEAISNLGNVYLAQKQIQSAIASYRQAISIHPERGAYYYNLYRAYTQESFLSPETDKVFQKARQLDPDLVGHYLAIDSPHINRIVIDECLTTERFWKRFLGGSVGGEGFLLSLFEIWLEKIPSRTSFLVPVIFLVFLIGMSRYARTKRLLTRCPMCGVSVYRLYKGHAEDEFGCFTCHRIFLAKEKLHPKITERKSLQVRQFQKEGQLITRFLSFFFLGFGYLWKERFIRGFIFLFLFFVFLLRLIYLDGIIPSSVAGLFQTPWGMILWGGLFAIFYLISLWRIFRLKPGFEVKQ